MQLNATARAFARALFALQLPATFVLSVSRAPTASFLLARAGGGGLYIQTVSLGVALPCIAVGVLLLVAGLSVWRAMEEGEDDAGTYDAEGGDAGDVLFWWAATMFVFVRNLLLLEEVDIFAVVLLTGAWLLAELAACRPADGARGLWVRLIGLSGLVTTTVLLSALVYMGMDSASEAYVLATCVVADALLVVGHTWDYPENSITTVRGSRFVYMCAAQLALPAAVAANTGAV